MNHLNHYKYSFPISKSSLLFGFTKHLIQVLELKTTSLILKANLLLIEFNSGFIFLYFIRFTPSNHLFHLKCHFIKSMISSIFK